MSNPLHKAGQLVLVETGNGMFDVVRVERVLGTDLTEEQALALLDEDETEEDDENGKH